MAGDLRGLGGVGEVRAEVGDGEHAGHPGLAAIVPGAAPVVPGGDVPPGWLPQRAVHSGLVGLDHEHVMGLFLLDQEPGVRALGVQRIRGHDGPLQVERHEESREAGDLAPVIAASRWAAGAAPCREMRVLLPSTASVSAPSGSLPVRSAGPPGQTVPMTRRGTRRERRRPGHRAGTGCAAGLRWPTVRSPGRNAPRRAPPRPRPAARSPAGDAGRAGHADPAAMRVDPPDECPMRVDARVQSRGRQTEPFPT